METEAARRRVQLLGTDAEVNQHAVHVVKPVGTRQRRQGAVIAVDQHRRARHRGQAQTRAGQRLLIPVDSQQPAGRPGAAQHFGRVPGIAQRAVDVDASRPHRKRRQRLIQHDCHMHRTDS